jgi:chlorite dismutase
MAQEGKRDFVNYSFFKMAPEWRRLAAEERGRSKAEFAGVVEEFADRMSLATYSLGGTRGDADLLLRTVSPTLQGINEQQAQVNWSKLHRYLTLPHSYLDSWPAARGRGCASLPPPG